MSRKTKTPYLSRRRRPVASEPELVAVGYLTKAHGIRGELSCVLTSDTPGLAQDLLGKRIYLRPKNGGETKAFTLVKFRTHHGGLLVTLDGIASRTDAEFLHSHTLFVPQYMLPPLEDGEVYVKDLPGLRVLVSPPEATDAPGTEIGVISAVSSPAGQMLWTIVTPDGNEILFPAVDEFIIAIEPDKGCARIAPPPGLLDLYLNE